MHLFLHWLLWDLRRFRPMLIVWTLLVLGYAAFLGWMHARILTIDVRWVEWSEPLALGLVVMEFFLLLVLFISNPAVGTGAFWKTRPPSARAVAGAKLAIALGFFLVLPLAAWGTMHALCVLPGGPRPGWEGMSWTRVLWLVHALGLSVFLIAGAEIRDARQLLLKMTAVLGMVGLVLGLSYGMLPTSPGFFFREGFQERWGLMMSGMAVLFGIRIFMKSNKRHSHGARVGWLDLLIPSILSVGVLVLAHVPHEALKAPEVTMAAPLPAAVASGLHIGQTDLAFSMDSWQQRKSQGKWLERFRTRIHVGGLPDGRRARARWLNLRVIPQTGPAVPALNPADVEPTDYQRNDDLGGISVAAADFDSQAILPLAGQACRAEGTLRVQLDHTVSWSMPMERQVVHWGSVGAYYLSGKSRPPGSQPEWAGKMTFFDPAPELPKWGALRHPQTNEVLRIELGKSASVPGFLMEYGQTQFFFNPGRGTPRLKGEEMQKRLNHFDGTGWMMDLFWYEAEGVVDLPVSLDLVVVPWRGREKVVEKAAEALAGISLPDGAEAAEVQRTVAYAWNLVKAQEDSASYAGGKAAPLPGWGPVLDQLRAAHLPMLLNLAEDTLRRRPLTYASRTWTYATDDALVDRVVSLLEPKDLAGLRARPKLFRWLGATLVRKGLIAPFELEPPAVGTLSDTALQERWEQGYEEYKSDLIALEEGARRGLPWAVEGIALLVDTMPFSREAEEMMQWFSQWSDFPKGRRGLDWLREHARQLKWDAASKKWVLPDPPGTAP